MNKSSIYRLTLDQLVAWLKERGHKKSQASLVWNYLYHKRVKEFAAMADVHPTCTELLSKHFVIHTLSEHVKQQSADGTTKFLFKLQDGNVIETVLMRHKFGLSVCVTTQVGCNIGCSFCASGLLTKNRDLSSGEMVEQIMEVQQHLDRIDQGDLVSHIVVMGIGEPFDNFNAIIHFLRIVIDHKGLAIGARRITISTSGLANKIKEFADINLRVNLAVSLHAANDELRTRIMKINRAIPIATVMEKIKYFVDTTNQRVTLEYILLKDVNDQRVHALELVQLVQQWNIEDSVNVNLIPYNAVDEHSHYQRSEQKVIREFYCVIKENGISCSVRLEHGTDIDAACGQLRSKQMKKARKRDADQATCLI